MTALIPLYTILLIFFILQFVIGVIAIFCLMILHIMRLLKNKSDKGIIK